MERILIVEDEKNIAELLEYNLINNNYDVDIAYDGEEAWNLYLSETYELILLDLMLPKINGIELCQKIRDIDIDIPIIMLTAKSSELDKIKGLNIGADDYITKPFSVKELLARINVIFRRVKKKDKLIKTIGDLVINFDSYILYKDSKEIDLTLKEFELLRLLVESYGEVVKRDTILEKVWGYNFVGETRTVDVHIRNLRAKIEDDPSKPQYIKTVRGVGYIMGMM